VRADHLKVAANAHGLFDGPVFRVRDHGVLSSESHAAQTS
jgi:hypothetical protein